MIPTHTQNVSTLAQLESVWKSEELKFEEKEERKASKIKFWRFSKSHNNFNIGLFDMQIFAIRSCAPTEATEVLKRNMYGWEKFCEKKSPTLLWDIFLSCGSSPLFARLGRRSLLLSLHKVDKGLFPLKDMQTPSLLRSGEHFLKDAKCAVLYGKYSTNFFFELWVKMHRKLR